MQFQIHHGRIDLENVRCTIQPQEIRDRSHGGKNMRVGLNLLSGCGTSVRRILVCQKKLYNILPKIIKKKLLDDIFITFRHTMALLLDGL